MAHAAQTGQHRRHRERRRRTDIRCRESRRAAGGVRLAADMARDDRDGAEFAHRARREQDDAVAAGPSEIFGSVTRQNICQPFAPSATAASSASAPCSSITGISSRATNGNVTNSVASTMPGIAKMILMSCATSHGPKAPCAPKSSTKTRPEMTGDTANGRSINVTSSGVPGTWKRAIAHAAAMPNVDVQRHAERGQDAVSHSARRASGSVIDAQYAVEPLGERLRRTPRPAAHEEQRRRKASARGRCRPPA